MDAEKVRQHVECPICLKVPRGHHIYMCVRSHVICAPCYGRLRPDGATRRKLCPQGRCHFANPLARNRALESIIEAADLGHECPNAGCDFEGSRPELDKHRPACMMNHVFCPEEGGCKTRVALPELTQHIRASHPNVVFVGSLSRHSRQKWLIKRAVHLARPSFAWNTVVGHAEGGVDVGIRAVKQADGLWCTWMVVFAGHEAAAAFKAEIRVRGPGGAVYSYVGQVPSVLTSGADVVDRGLCLMLPESLALKCVSGEDISAESRKSGFDAQLTVDYRVVREGTGVAGAPTGTVANVAATRSARVSLGTSGRASSVATATQTAGGGGVTVRRSRCPITPILR